MCFKSKHFSVCVEFCNPNHHQISMIYLNVMIYLIDKPRMCACACACVCGVLCEAGIVCEARTGPCLTPSSLWPPFQLLLQQEVPSLWCSLQKETAGILKLVADALPPTPAS